MSDLGVLAINGLVTWRACSLLLYEDGPFSVFRRFRRVVRADRPGELKFAAALFNCIWCLSVWVGAAFAVVTALYFDEWYFVLLALSSSAIAVLVDSRVRYGRT